MLIAVKLPQCMDHCNVNKNENRWIEIVVLRKGNFVIS